MYTKFQKTAFSFILILFMVFSSSSVFAYYQKVEFKRPTCLIKPPTTRQTPCSMDQGDMISVIKYNSKTREHFETKLENDGVGLFSSKTKKIVTRFKGPEASIYLLITESKISEKVLYKAIVSAYKISEANAITHYRNVRKVLAKQNQFRGIYKTGQYPNSYKFYVFY